MYGTDSVEYRCHARSQRRELGTCVTTHYVQIFSQNGLIKLNYLSPSSNIPPNNFYFQIKLNEVNISANSEWLESSRVTNSHSRV